MDDLEIYIPLRAPKHKTYSSSDFTFVLLLWVNWSIIMLEFALIGTVLKCDTGCQKYIFAQLSLLISNAQFEKLKGRSFIDTAHVTHK